MTLFIDLHRIRSIFQSTSIGSNNLLFYTERSWRSGTGLWLGNESLVWLSAANQIYLTKYVCPSIHLFICLSVQQPVHWFIVNPCLHLLTCPSTRPPAHPCTNHGPPACQSSHTCILSIHLSICLFVHYQFFFQSFWLCACYSICPSSIHLPCFCSPNE